MRDPERLIVRTPEQFKERQNIDVFTEHRVTRIDTGQKLIEVADLRDSSLRLVSFDRLIIATGARSRGFDLPGGTAENVFTLKTVQDGYDIKAFLDGRGPKRAAILGAGYIALEMCEAFVRRGLETSILYRGRLPASNLDVEISEMILREIEARGVRFVPDCHVASLGTAATGGVGRVETDRGSYDVDLVLVAHGVVPNVELARKAGISLGETGAIRVDSTQRTDVEGIYAAGDCCESLHLVSGRPVHAPLGDIANKQGRVAGENAAGGRATFRGIVGSIAFKVFDLEVASTGLSTKAARAHGFHVETQMIEHSSRVGYMPGAKPVTVKLVFDRENGRLLGAQMAGKEGVARRINSLAVALHQGMTVDEVARLDFAYAPPFSPTFDPILIAAEQASKKL
ncbi:MAG: FAD-dependent oxidoreductase [Deltaproteobacteria bacterium]|nr:FAD-dependent oxidoreductase [Deltaproteobacteria bacterium]MBW2121986.1 FAD-dependent oxidoreductase [Deltaproteobacteria bacterium]